MIRCLASGAMVLVTLVAGCGDDSPDDARDSDKNPAPVVYDESEVKEHLGLDVNNVVFTPEGVECEVAVVLTSESAVDLYADAGDTVATNPDGTAGVKNVSSERETCQEFFTNALSTFPGGQPAETGSSSPEESPLGTTYGNNPYVEVTVSEYLARVTTGGDRVDAVNVRICNVSDSALSLSWDTWAVKDSNDGRYDSTYDTVDLQPLMPDYEDVSAQDCASGYIPFSVAEDARITTVEYRPGALPGHDWSVE